ncbi:MAG TPA: hypothetical protein VHT91_00415 [Kofleriaceae bacterium]|nr:hypothetical protein [Kofleriaceae bacterium]
MALKLSWQSWPGEVAEAAKSAFSDPGFLITLVLIIAVYVGLWLTPEPTMITKVAAGVLTVVLLAQFAWEDIYGLAKAWMALQSDCTGANSVTSLQAAGDKFAQEGRPGRLRHLDGDRDVGHGEGRRAEGIQARRPAGDRTRNRRGHYRGSQTR